MASLQRNFKELLMLFSQLINKQAFYWSI